MEQTDRPSFLSLTRQGIPPQNRDFEEGADALRKGAYILAEASTGSPQVILMGTGSELQLAVEAREALEAGGTPTRVVSMPSWRLFMDQDAEYRNEVFPPEVTARVSVEAGTTLGWERWVGSGGASVGVDHFGASAPWDVLYTEFGITTEAVLKAARGLLGN
jgi:transketolase